MHSGRNDYSGLTCPGFGGGRRTQGSDAVEWLGIPASCSLAQGAACVLGHSEGGSINGLFVSFLTQFT